MTDYTDLREAAEKATPGPWDTDSIDNEGDYGSGPYTQSGFKSYAVGAGPPDKWRCICDTLNSDLIEVEVDVDSDRTSAWDEVGRRNAAFIALANPARILALLDEIDRLREALTRIANYQVRAILPWTHEAAADEYSMALHNNRSIARAALKEKPHD